MNDQLEVLEQLIPRIAQARIGEQFGEAFQDACQHTQDLIPGIERMERWQLSIHLRLAGMATPNQRRYWFAWEPRRFIVRIWGHTGVGAPYDFDCEARCGTSIPIPAHFRPSRIPSRIAGRCGNNSKGLGCHWCRRVGRGIFERTGE